MKLRRWAFALSLTVLLIGSLVGFKTWQIQSAIAHVENFPEYAETVTLATVEPHTLQNEISVMGSVVAPQRVVMRSESAGRVTQLTVMPNQQVTAGELLVQLDVSAEQAQIQAAKARRMLAELEVNRFIKLQQQQSVSQAELDAALADLAVVDAQLAELDSAIARKTVRAPFDGVMGLHRLALGLYLEPGSTIGELVGQQPFIWVEFAVPQFYPALQMNDRVAVQPIQQQQQTPNTLQERNATIIARDPGLAAATRSVLYRAQVALTENINNRYLAHNMAVKVRVPIGPIQTQFTVPASALQFDRQGAFIYQLHPENKEAHSYRSERRNVKMIARQGDLIILAPLSKNAERQLIGGELVAAQGAFKLQPNMLVYPRLPITENSGEVAVNSPPSLEATTSQWEG